MQSEFTENNSNLRLVINSILNDSTDVQKADFLIAINESENSSEIVAELATIIKNRASLSRISNVSDIVGTGGDSKNTINVSTASALVVSSLGVRIAKHGNFGATSNKGSADFLRFLGYNFEMDQTSLERRVTETSFAFILAPRFNDSFAKFAIARKMIAVKTAFNYLGPLTNPADPDILMLGVTNDKISNLYVNYMLLNGKRGCVLYSEDGMDEISPYSSTNITFIRDNESTKEIISPDEIFGERIGIEQISRADPDESFRLTMDGLTGHNNNAARFIALNAGLSLLINGRVNYVSEGYRNALEAINSGLVHEHLQRVLEVASFA